MKNMMKMTMIVALLLLATTSYALDPYAPKENRSLGFLSVTTPLPDSDKITATHAATGKQYSLKSGEVMHVPVGDYQIQVQLQNNSEQRKTQVLSTERSDVIIVGYGNVKVSATDDAKVEIYRANGGASVGQCKPNAVCTLPSGTYDVEVRGKNWKVKDPVTVVTNTTREVVVK